MSDPAGKTVVADGSASAPSPGGQAFYRYTDDSGKVVIVDSLDKLPKSAAGRAERIELAEGPSAVERGLNTARQATSLDSFNLPSFALGVGGAVVLVVVALLVKRSGSLFIAKLIGIAAVAALLGGLYLGVLRRATGQDDAVFATPNQIIEDARSTVERANQSRKRQQELIDEIGREGKQPESR